MGFYPGPPSAALSGPARGQSQDGLGLGLGFKPLPTPDYYPPQHHQEQEQGQDQQPVEPASALSTSSAERRAFADPPPAYQVQPLPAYDPSRYHGVDRFDSFRAQGGVGYAGGGYGHVDGQAWRAQGQGGVGVDHMVGIAVPYPGVRASMYRFEEGEGGVRRVPERDEMAFSFAETAFSLGEDVGSGGGGGGGGDGGRGRRRGGVFLDGDESQGEGVVQRPRPVLSRLVTDFR
ncbi:hypothetical protein BO71DRAFT_254126 [Aspergillus ellipticus CBS 707.79]|uniref:Uncharacterized protein n=1 Tax=Aspergillus ellipticus CBS 707.79 TaxID=1448320 RepID=A0A319ERK6_9EURO|nr:hypothetical protein BO71DRAFT_254126 [Aspergillus ellipticus CBS 707.79]